MQLVKQKVSHFAMLKLTTYLLSIVTIIINYGACQDMSVDSETEEVSQFLKKYDKKAAIANNLMTKKSWKFETNVTEHNEEEMRKQEMISIKFQKQMRETALLFNSSALSTRIQRQLQNIKDIGPAAHPDVAKVEELTKILSEMITIYSTAKVCLSPDNCMSLEPEIKEYFAKEQDYDTLLALWSGWRNATGRKMKDLFPRYVELSNEAVGFLGFNDVGEEWRSLYESDTFVDDIKDLFDQVRPLYEQLHAFVRRRLIKIYGSERFPASGHIPAHLLGDIWGQVWSNILEIVKPFEDKPAMDVTEEMIRQNYTVQKIFRTAEDFFVSLGFEKMTRSFWLKSMFVKPSDGREVVCHASAWDFFDKKDYRIKMCTVITQEDLMTVHHEMGHVQYNMQYSNQPVVFRGGANPGFHEAVGDVIALSVQTPEHMYKIDLIQDVPTDKETDINFLMNMALQKVPFLPFSFLVDHWLWDVFSGKTTPETYNKEWWALRCKLQGVSPPIPRSEDDFDPGAKYHIPASVPYIRYFVSVIIQFQFHKAACEAAGNTGPLHRCDIYKSRAAGKKIRKMLKLGSSQPWPVAMKQLTGQEKMDASALLEYFQPLLDFLRTENGDDFGWDPNCPVQT